MVATHASPGTTNNNVTEDPQAGMNFLEKGWAALMEHLKTVSHRSSCLIKAADLDIAEFNKMAQRAGAGGFDMLLLVHKLGNEDKLDIQRVGLLAPFDDKPAQVMRDISRGLNFLLWVATKLGGRALSGGVGGLKMGAGIAGMKKAVSEFVTGVKTLGKIGAKW